MFRRWRRIDRPGLELARIDIEKRGVTVSSTLVDACASHPYSLRYIWTLTPQWRTRTLRIEHMNGDDRWLTIDRAGDSSWRLDNKPAPHLDGCTELDVSATPFCNTLAMRLLGKDGALTVAYVSAEDLGVQPSRQRYEKFTETHWRYHDLGVADGFTADLYLDDAGLVKMYDGLFEAID